MEPYDPEHRDETGTAASDSGLLRELTGRLFRDTLRYIPAAVLPAALSVVSASVFTRIFTPDEYGRYALVLVATVFAGAILSGWMQQSVLRYLPRFKVDGRLDEFLNKLLVMLLGVSLAVALLLLLTRPFLVNTLGGYTTFLIPAVLLVLSEMFFMNLGSAFQANLRPKTYSLFKISNAALRLGLSLAFVLLIRRDVVGLIIGAVVANILLVGPMLRQHGVLSRPAGIGRLVDFGFFKLFAVYGFPMIGWILCAQILDLSDRVVLGALRGSREVGIYSANYNLVRMGFGLVSGPVLTALYAVVMNAWEKGHREQIADIISEFSRYYMLAIVPLITFVSVFRLEIVSIVLGSEFREGYTIVPFVLAGTMVWGLAMIGHKGLEIYEKTTTMLMLVIISALANIILNFVFIPKYGYNGAAFATFISYLLYPILVYVATKRLVPWRIPWLGIGRIVVAAAVMAGVMMVIGGSVDELVPAIVGLIIAGIAGIAVYLGVLFLTREWRPIKRGASS